MDEAARGALAGLRLPHLSRLMARLAPLPREATAGNDPASDPGHPTGLSLSLPHERTLARAWGLPCQDGQMPWTAWREARVTETTSSDASNASNASNASDSPPAAFARFTPCHWAVGSDHIALRDPEALQLGDDESQALLAAMQPYFEEDGLQVRWDSALCWTARGEMLRALPCASLDRVIGRRIDDWLSRTPAARPLRRLQQEMQMLLYTHPVNESREALGLLPVNSFWVDGAGALPAGRSTQAAQTIRLDDSLRRPALQGDAAAWTAAWQALDAQLLAPLLAALDAGQAIHLTLAGEHHATTFGPRTATGLGGALAGLVARWRAPSPAQVLNTL